MSKLQPGVSRVIFKEGKLTSNEQQESNSHRIISYGHTHTADPDRYYTNTFKSYKTELDQLKISYAELQRAYWGLLGYHPADGQENINCLKIPATPRNCKQYRSLDSTNASIIDSAKPINVTSFDLGGKQENKKRLTDCSMSRIYDELNSSLWTTEFNSRDLGVSERENESKMMKASTEENEEETEQDEEEENEEGLATQQIKETLMAAFDQIRVLKQAMDKAEQRTEMKAQEIREEYEAHIKKLEEILERERKNCRMLNGVINRIRNEVNTKDAALKNVMNLKTLDKASFDKLIKGLKN